MAKIFFPKGASQGYSQQHQNAWDSQTYQPLTNDFVEQINVRQRAIGDMTNWADVYTNAMGGMTSPTEVNPGETLNLIKKSIKQIKAEAVSKQAQEKIASKIDRLKKLGVTKQSQILEGELQVRMKLAKVQEWDYKVLPQEAIKDFDKRNKVTAVKDGLKVHIDTLDKYCGVLDATDEKVKDKIIPDFVLDKLQEAKDRQVFDEFGILWVEKVKDPLLLGAINGCLDYFLICEWGDDVKFDDMVK